MVTAFSIFTILLMAGVPIAFVLGLSAFFYFFIQDPRYMQILVLRFYGSLDFFVLLAVPLFIFGGELMNASGVTHRLVRFSNMVIGRAKGGLAHVNVITSIFFAGITGAAISDVAALGTVFIPTMKKEGYTGPFSAAITATSSIVGPLIPPSTILLVYGALTNTSIAALFAAGMVPGVLIGITDMIIVHLLAKKRNFPRHEVSFSIKEFITSLRDSLLALVMPGIILGGLLSGVFTPTEAAAVACGYALLIGFFVYRSLRFLDVYRTLRIAVVSSAKVLIIIACAGAFGWILTSYRVAETMAASIMRWTSSPIAVILLIALFLLFLGTWMETLAAITMLAPFLGLMAKHMGFHPVHFGIVVVLALDIGLVTPPVGLCLYSVCGLSGERFERVVRETLPFLALDIVVLILLSMFPDLFLWVPKLFNLI